MKRLFLFLMVWCLGMPFATAQTATSVNEGLRITTGTTAGTQVIAWWGKAGRTYFVQQSFDLIHWNYVPFVQSGAEVVAGLNVSSTDSRQFWRLRYTDVSTGVLSAADADSDGDGLSNYAELYIYNTDPLNPDSDGDGVSDGQEVADGTDPNVLASNAPAIVGLRVFTLLDAAP
jgi:Bacterial TSP3 repeat